jgi:hypothetical protein
MDTENNERLAFAGPAHPDHGFPMWFEDKNGMRLELVLNEDPMAPAIGELPTPGAALSFPSNYPDEAFYFMAEAQLPVGGVGIVGRARIILALEAAFGASGAPDPRTRIVFGRLRVRMDDLIPGAKYKVTHPYGVLDELEADEGGRVFHTVDWGIIENDGTAVLRSGQVAPFLTWDAGAPVGYIGDGITDHRITGSPFGTNFVRIEGPRIAEAGGTPDPADPANPDKVWTDLFSVQGRIARQIGAQPTQCVSTPTAAGVRIGVHASSAPGQSLELVGDGLRVAMTGGAAGGRDYVGLAEVAALPATLHVINVSDTQPTRFPMQATDGVIIESAVHDISAQSLTIRARSSDPAAVLKLQPLNLLIDSLPKTFSGIAATPAVIHVESSKGGSAEQHVEIVGTPAPLLGLIAHAVTPMATRVGQELVLDGRGSRGATSYSWTQTIGSAVSLLDVNTPQARFTPSSVGNRAFQLTVTDSGGATSAVTVNVTVDAALPPDVLVIEQIEYRTSKRQFRISGTVSNTPNAIIVRLGAIELGRASPDAAGAWSVRRTLSDSENALAPAVGSSLQASSATSVQTALINIRN